MVMAVLVLVAVVLTTAVVLPAVAASGNNSSTAATVATATPEARGFWVVRDQLTTPENIRAIVDTAAANNFNLLIVQVSGRGDAYYQSDLMPRARGLSSQPASFDPLALIIKLAHERGLKVHAWLNDFYVAPFQDEAEPNHVIRQHPDWVTYDYQGRSATTLTSADNVVDVEGMFLDPGLPEVREWVAARFAEVVRKYDADGVHHDFVRYPDPNFGFHPRVREEFKSKYGVDPIEIRNNPSELRKQLGRDKFNEVRDAWTKYRVDAVNSTVKAVAEAVRAVKPNIEISAATVAYYKSAVEEKGQDWFAWLENGWIDTAIPMAYSPETATVDYHVKEAVLHQAGGSVYAGLGAWLQLDQPAALVEKVKHARELGAKGVVFFDYGSMAARPGFIEAVAREVFPSPAPYPASKRAAAEASVESVTPSLPFAKGTKGYFVLMTDTHTGLLPTNKMAQAIVKDIIDSGIKPAFVLNMGDLTEMGSAYEQKLFAQYWGPLAEAFPLKVTLGNHDARWAAQGKEPFRQKYGQPYYSFDFAGVHFVVLDTSTYLEAWGHISREQLEWLKNDLAALPAGQPVLLFSHHPLNWDTDFVDNQDVVSRIIAPYNVGVVFSGHGHSYITQKANGMTSQMIEAAMTGHYAVVAITANGAVEVWDREAGKPFGPEGYKLVGRFPLARAGNTGVGARKTSDAVTGQAANGAVAAEAPAPANGLLKISWTIDTGTDIHSTPAVDEHAAYIGTEKGDFLAVNRANGKILWRFKAGDAILSSPAVAEGRVYFGSNDKNIYALDAKTGALLWSKTTGGAVYSDPEVADGVVYIGSGDGKLYALDAATGAEKWTYRALGYIESKPLARDGKVFFTSWDGNGYVIDAATGKRLAYVIAGAGGGYTTPGPSSPAEVSGVVSFSSTGGKVYGIAATDGKKLWTVDKNSGYASPAAAGGRFYYTTIGGEVYAVDAMTGEVKWTAQAGEEIYDGSAAVWQDLLVVGTVKGNLALFRATDGKALGKVRVADGYLFAPAAVSADGKELFVGAMDGYLYAFSRR